MSSCLREWLRGDPGHSASYYCYCRCPPQSQPSSRETPPTDWAAQRGRGSGPGGLILNLQGDRGSLGLESVNRTAGLQCYGDSKGQNQRDLLSSLV